MIIIPEIEKVVLLVPRAGSTALKTAVLKAYPNAFQLYRHMEADGVPHGYNYFEKVGIVRDPVDRLWSLYKYLKDFGGDYEPAYIEAMRRNVALSFNDWILKNELPFTTPYDSSYNGKFFPKYTVLHGLPENRKSQFVYLRPDLGTKIFQYSKFNTIFDYLELGSPEKLNQSTDSKQPELGAETKRYMHKVFRWDYIETGEETP